MSGDAERGGAAVDAGDFSCGPTAACVIVIAMRVEKQQELFDAIQSQKHLCVAVRDETENSAAARASDTHIGDYTNGRGAVSAHAIDHEAGQAWRQNVCLQQFGVRTMRPLLGARALLGH